MNSLPCLTKGTHGLIQNPSDVIYLRTGETVVLAKLNWTARTVQIEDRFMLGADHVNVSRTVIVRVDGHPQAMEPEDRRHEDIVS